MDIGIDLGTTSSVVAVNGRVALRGEYPEGIALDNCDVTVVPTPQGDQTFPSAVWEDPDTPGAFLIGYEALVKADAGEAPILFSKRKIGTAEEIPMHDHMMLARDAAVVILKYMKECAEQALGEPVERAVVSHPAYFDRSQVEETRQAAIAAGFDMSRPEQMLMEPVAAALAYTRTDKRDPLRILTYDLGGGTFDVTYLERRGGIIFMRAFDGDHLLGGYNFDRELLHWLLNRIRSKGREIVLDETKPQDRGRLARLLRLAEATKIKLAGAPSDDTRIEIRAPDVLVDVNGRTVPILESISRREFVALIHPLLEMTIEQSRRAMKKADVQCRDLDEIILVGGSTYGPWVQNLIADSFPGARFSLFHPDLCVAAGAAIHAHMVLPSLVHISKYRVLLNVSEKSVLDQIDVIGQISGGPVKGLDVALLLPNGRQLGPQTVSANGQFRFTDVRLAEEGVTRFSLCVYKGTEDTVLKHDFGVLYAPMSTDATTITTVLPKPLFLETLDGLVALAPEGISLPTKCDQVLVRDNDNPNIFVRIFQEDRPIGGIRIENIPAEGGRGSRVELECIVTEKNQITGEAKIISPSGRLIKTTEVLVTFDVPKVPDISMLRNHFEQLNYEYNMILRDSADRRLTHHLDLTARPLIDRISHLFEQQPVERQEINAALMQLERVILPAADPMVPAKKHFIDLLDSCRKAIALMSAEAETVLTQAKVSGPSATWRKGTARQRQPTDHAGRPDAAVLAKAKDTLRKCEQCAKILERVEKNGLRAHERRDRKAWAEANDTLAGIQSRLRNQSGAAHDSALMKFIVAMDVDSEMSRLVAQHRRLEQEGRMDDWNAEIQRLASCISQIRRAVMEIGEDQPADRVRAQLAVLLTQQLKPVRQAIDRLGVDTHKK